MYSTIGSFYYRPMDQILHRLTDYPQQSQPPQHMHLAIIRETGISGRQTHYRYFSYRWHQELVAEGVAVQPWGPAIKKKGSKQVSHGAITHVTETPLSLDKYGFPAPNTSRFLKSDGSATLAESQWEGKKNERLDSLKAQFRVLRNKVGEEQLDWKNSSPRGGRPRKYEKGKEPYLAAKRRAEARRIIAERATGSAEPGGADPDGMTRGRSLSNETEGGTLDGEPPPKKARIEELLNQEDPEPLSPPKRRGRPPGVKNGEGKKRQAAKKREKRPKVIPKRSTGGSQKAQEPKEQQKPQFGLIGAEPERNLQENLGSLGKRKAQAAGGKTGRAKRRKETRQASPPEDDGVIIYDSIVVRPSTELAPDTQVIDSAEPALAGPAPGDIEQSVGHPSKEPARVVDGVQLEIEHLDVEGNESYGSIGGMLAISRQQVVLDLLKENNGVFPSGNELRHAYSKRYQKSNPKAGVCDRRLIRGIVQSLQRRKMAYQITFDFTSSRSILITKKLLVDSRLTPDSPLVDDMVREMIAADGNLWFPPNTELHEDIQERFVQPPSWSLSKPRKSEEVEFDRVYPTSVSELKQKREARAIERAANKAAKLSVIARPRGRPRTYPVDEVFNHRAGGKFTDQQREEAAIRRRAELKAEKELMRLNHKYRTKATNIDLFDQSPTVDGLPRRVWWNEFVERDLNEPRETDPFLQQINEIEKWEKAVGPEGLRMMARKAGGMVMVNLFAPPVEKGDNFTQAPVANMDNRITAPDFSAPLPSGPKKRGPKPRPKKIRNDPVKARTIDVLIGEQPAKRKRRRPGTYEKPLTRRDRAMAAIRDNQLKPSDTELLTELPPRRFQFRNQYIIPKEDEDTLLIAVIIVRTIFGGWDRKIHWGLLTKALPQHSVITLQRRWPRVRDTHKAHMKKLQAEFEDMFLEAYESGEVPAFDLDDPSSFDLMFHVNWFRENLELPV
ncbi:unnamed protein product [Tuber melanosporum]|uniref:(Perigord truffle) hypothetical protein n=1 Tax=Tuber melanosporum (strain Mel28) TaxID=656061 RepID=D5GMB7_TUBMM|nr:uncharacterized protein GSTUM_00010639001 [Tuber melanosporum]CAZ85660.1 unnamed protein product [Tuber melanosporum]